MRRRVTVLALPMVLGIAACGEGPVAPTVPAIPETALFQRPQRGTGLALENVLGGLPIIGNVQITQVVITEFSTFLGGLQASGTITGTTLTTPVVTLTDDFTADVLISSTSGGRCDLVTIDLSGLNADVLGLVQADFPVATVSGQGSGAIGPLLCNLGRVVNTAGGVVRGLLNAINNLI